VTLDLVIVPDHLPVEMSHVLLCTLCLLCVPAGLLCTRGMFLAMPAISVFLQTHGDVAFLSCRTVGCSLKGFTCDTLGDLTAMTVG
jgi:hypothetical protein